MMLRFREVIARAWRRNPVQAEPDGFRYRAFLSYRTADQAAAKRLHEKLERYRVPKALVGKPGELGPVPPVVGRVFRDREELRTSDDIETIIAQELSNAQQLIVFCTPRAVDAEAWVGREIEIFRHRRPDGRIHAVIGEGEPPACFPRQLLRLAPDGKLHQPLAADMRPPGKGGQDGEARAFIKIVASLVGVGFDDLWKREQRRRWQRLAAASLAVMILGVAAWMMYARSEAFKAAAQNTDARSLWQQARELRQANPLLSMHLMTEAAAMATDSRLRNAVILDRVQSLETTRLVASWDVPVDARSFAVALASGGKKAVVWSGAGLTLFDLAAKPAPPRDLIARGSYEHAQFNASGTRALLLIEGGEAEIADAGTGQITSPRVKHGAPIFRAGFTQDERAFFTADARGHVRTWNVSDGAALGQTTTGVDKDRPTLEHVTLSPDGRWALIITRHPDHFSDSHFSVIRLWNLQTQTILASNDPRAGEPRHDAETNGTFSRNGRSLLSWKEGSAWILDVRDRANRGLKMPHPREEIIKGAVFDDSERLVVTWTSSSIIRVWDVAAAGGPLERDVLKFDGRVAGLAIDDAHNAIVAWAADGTLRAWALTDGAPLGSPIRHRTPPECATKRPESHQAPVATSVELSQSGKRLLSWGKDSFVRVLDPLTCREVALAMSHRDAVLGAAFTSDDSMVLTWSADGMLRLWSIEASAVRAARQLWMTSFGESGREPSELGVSYVWNKDPSRRLTWGDDGTVTIWDLENGAPVATSVALREATLAFVSARKASDGLAADLKPRVAFNRQGTRLVIYGSREASFVARLWDVESGRALAELGSPQHVTFNHEGTFFATWSEDDALTLRASSDGQSIGTEVSLLTKHERNPVERVEDVVINSGGDRLAVVYQDDGDRDPSVRIWAMEQGKYIGAEIDPVSGVHFSPRGDRLVLWRRITRGGDPRLKPFATLVDATSGAVISNGIDMDKWDPNKLFDRRGAWLFGTSSVWDTANGERVGQDVRGGLSNATSKHVVFLVGSGNAELVDMLSGQPTGMVLHHGDTLKQAFLDGSVLVTVGRNTMKLWSLENGKQIGSQMPLELGEEVNGLLLSPSRARVLTWDHRSGLARLREPKSGRQVGATMQIGQGAKGVALIDELGLIITDGTITLWDDFLCEPLSFKLHDWVPRGAGRALFVAGRSSLLMWQGGVAAELDLSELLRSAGELRRTQVAALTGAEYDSTARQLRVLTSENWRSRVEQQAKQ